MRQIKSFSREKALMNAISKMGQVRTTEATLRSEILLGSGGGYNFNLNANASGIALPTEIKLNQSDSFIPTEIAFFLKKAGTSTTPTEEEQSYAKLHTFPNSVVFNGANEARNLNAIYNSNYTLNINSVNVIEKFDLLQFKEVGTSQQGIQLSQQSAAVGPNGSFIDSEWKGGDYGFAKIKADLCLNGAAKNILTVTLPTAVNCAGTNSNNYLVVMMRGVMALNGSDMLKDGSSKVFNQNG